MWNLLISYIQIYYCNFLMKRLNILLTRLIRCPFKSFTSRGDGSPLSLQNEAPSLRCRQSHFLLDSFSLFHLFFGMLEGEFPW